MAARLGGDEAVLVRVLAALDDILTTTGGHGDVLAVSHGGIIYTLEGHFGLAHERIANLELAGFTTTDLRGDSASACCSPPTTSPSTTRTSSDEQRRSPPPRPNPPGARSAAFVVRYPVEVIRSDKRNKLSRPASSTG